MKLICQRSQDAKNAYGPGGRGRDGTSLTTTKIQDWN